MIRSLLILAIGALFGGGLAISGMLNPSKVAGFLDLFGVWDPSLAFVMGGGVVVNFIGHRIVTKRSAPLFGDQFRLPTAQDIDRKLVTGAVLFGMGWGIAGLCPGPVISSAILNPETGLLFAAVMIFGLFMGQRIAQKMG